jgi:hypothetical protein
MLEFQLGHVKGHVAIILSQYSWCGLVTRRFLKRNIAGRGKFQSELESRFTMLSGLIEASSAMAFPAQAFPIF